MAVKRIDEGEAAVAGCGTTTGVGDGDVRFDVTDDEVEDDDAVVVVA